ncbi:signal-regulatory protein beta-1-like [Oenanthe melanoleuca]|uniref:signal-regulatory protein beta-1-like n=1 Tax=Oenanthe melanoleuca TaxID=2939378 RepID=UPI0024C1D3AC|nr:signal-regulatory protein beta-1-like [Oenanthe melanoleuca]
MQELPLLCLMLLLLCRDMGMSAQGFTLHQPQDKVSVEQGKTLTLNCTTSGRDIIGPVRWLKSWGSENKTIYDQRESFPRVTRAVDGSDTDFTIHIRNIQPEDMGTYYCVKYTRGDTGEEVVFQRGSGTEVSVQAKPSPVLVSGPEQRAVPGQSVPFTCTTGGFFPKEIGVKWFKNKNPMVAQQPQVTEWSLKTYNLSSTVRVTLQKDDVPSELTCEVQHSTLPAPLRGSFQLSRVLRVPPSVEVSAEPSPAEVDKTVTFTCLVKEFYPAAVSISWLENGIQIKVEDVSQPSELSKGLFRLESQVEVQAREEKNGSTITCVVVHDAQAPATSSALLWISNVAHSRSQMGQNFVSSLLLLCLGILLEKALLAGLLFFLFKHMKSKALEMLPYPAPPQSLAPRAGSQDLPTATSDV